MRFMNTQTYPIVLAHLVWRDAGFDIMLFQRAGKKARKMSGFNQYACGGSNVLVMF